MDDTPEHIEKSETFTAFICGISLAFLYYKELAQNKSRAARNSTYEEMLGEFLNEKIIWEEKK